MAKQRPSSRSDSSSSSRRGGRSAARSSGRPGALPPGKKRRPASGAGSSTGSTTRKQIPRRRSKKADPDADPNVQRLQRVMASAGIGSRRDCEGIILEGRVEVDGKVVTELGTRVDLTKASVVVDAVELKLQPLQYFMLNKPPGVLSTSADPSGRMRVIDLINTRNRVYNVGRLDMSSEGLILVTNDGDLANRLTHPRYGVEKRYHVQVVGHPNRDSLAALVHGVYLAEGRAKATSAKYLRRAKENSWIEIILQEGRNREIRRLLAKIGHKVLTLRRVTMGSLKLGDLPVGAHRELTAHEVRALQADGTGKRAKVARPKPKGVKVKPHDLADVKEAAKKPQHPSAKRAAKQAAARKPASSRSTKKASTRRAPTNKSRRGAGKNVPARRPSRKRS